MSTQPIGSLSKYRSNLTQPAGWSRRTILCAALLLVVTGLSASAVWLFAAQHETPVYGFRVVNAFPHDRSAYCQGLLVDDGQLYEGTGRVGYSSLRRVELATGRVLQQKDIDRTHFGEGITIFGQRIYQITWKAGVCYVYDRKTFRELKRLQYKGQGWGLTHDDKHLIMSNGSSLLQYLDPSTLKVVRKVWVQDSDRAVQELNELEYVNGEIWANIWHRDHIARIDPTTGNVVGWIDLTELYPLRRRSNRENVLNGIAYDAQADRLFVTGKNWPNLFEIKIKKAR